MREARIDLGAIRSNIATLRSAVSPAALMVVVKAEGYGHGAIEAAKAAVDAGTDWLGVVDLAEALALREAGITIPILAWLHGEDADFTAAVAANIDVGVSSLGQLERAAATGGLAQIQIKVDTGLSRNGVEERESAALFERAAAHERAGRVRVRGLWSHLANAGEAEDLEQVRRFTLFVDAARDAGLTPELRHLAATAGALRVPESRFDLVRIGVGVYGLSPFEDASSAELGLRPAMELSAEIISVKRVPAGAGVSYGYAYRTSAETTLALVPLGYADGIPRHASSVAGKTGAADRPGAPVSINGRAYRVCGRVAMDQFVVDVGDDQVRVGDRAILFGDPTTGVPSADDWADAADTINYEIVTRIGPRVTRVFVP
ncbi:MAG: alanine racemase [Actinomycetota bacterium]|nr:alanine racemase [Actinomycetota bacterium]MDQ1574656.1 alanine racemase [Actinomycetota bacterium]